MIWHALHDVVLSVRKNIVFFCFVSCCCCRFDAFQFIFMGEKVVKKDVSTLGSHTQKKKPYN